MLMPYESAFLKTPENRAHFESEKEAIHLLLTGIGDEIYSTVDAYKPYLASFGHSPLTNDNSAGTDVWESEGQVKDSTYHKEKMLLCKQAEKGFQLQAEPSDWLADTDEEIDEQEFEAHYSYLGNKIEEVPMQDFRI
ncbi:hypothetical protein Tco_0857557 [Tanacetum coccineum]|uniref:Uncharacterized protein n=1 Tax=Tanacetum coccineum TaxID=301880 RepID=A0ABQ5B6J6_9ASTR